MDEPLLHDPRTKQQIKDAIYSYLYGPVLKQFALRMDAIVIKNAVLLGSGEMSFVYKGETYSTGGLLPRKMSRLSKLLHPIMEEYLKDVKQLNSYELPYVLNFIGQVLNSSNDLQDYLLVLPSAVHQPVQQLIASCPCRAKKLTLDGIKLLQLKNEVPINLIKQRLVTNLLI